MLTMATLFKKHLLIYFALISIYILISTQLQQLYSIDANTNEINIITALDKLPSFPNANCSIIWRKQNQIPMNDEALLRLAKHNVLYQYHYPKVPKATFTYWLSHIYSHIKIKEKAYFADKFLVKKYIEQMRKKFPLFNSINYARILYDLEDGFPSYATLKNLSLHQGFVIKPNHMSSNQFIVPPNNTFTTETYSKIRLHLKRWVRRKWKVSKKVEPWYGLIRPHGFIEEYLNIDINKEISKYQMVEYKINVFNFKAVFGYIGVKRNFSADFPDNGTTHWLNNYNLYILPEFHFLNIYWGRHDNKRYDLPMPSKENLNLMIQFAETFARTEGFRYVRVDVYEINKKIYFSEFTFAPISGVGILTPISIDYCLYDILCDNKQEDFNKFYQYVL
eukprot:251687_1